MAGLAPDAETHEALRDLWIAADLVVREHPDAIARDYEGTIIRTYEDDGLEVARLGDVVHVECDFERPTGVDERVCVKFPADIRFLTEQTVIDLERSKAVGGNTTPKKRDFARLAAEVLAVLPQLEPRASSRNN